MRKLRSARLESLIAKLGAQSSWVSQREDEVSLAAVEGVRRKVRLLGQREVNETVTTQRRRNVLAGRPCGLPRCLPRNVND
jgi:hypothetical protein